LSQRPRSAADAYHVITFIRDGANIEQIATRQKCSVRQVNMTIEPGSRRFQMEPARRPASRWSPSYTRQLDYAGRHHTRL